MKTAEEILDEIFYKPEIREWYKPVIKAMQEYRNQGLRIPTKEESETELEKYAKLPDKDFTISSDGALGWRLCYNWMRDRINNHGRTDIEDKDKLKDELVKFKKWIESLSPASKCTVHAPAGSGGSYGIYNLSDIQLIEKYLNNHK